MKESEWTRRVGKALTDVGALVVPNVMGKMVNHVPDRTVICKHGVFYIEFKGRTTRLRPGQKIWMKNANLRCPCAFVYRFPNLLWLGPEVGDPVVVDALENPTKFLETLVLISKG